MRKINRIFWHCSATRRSQTEVNAEKIRDWHLGRGWRDIGYHYVVELDGSIEQGRPEEQIGAHAGGHNGDSIGVCYVGGLDENGRPADTRTPEQRAALYELTDDILSRHPGATIHGHNEVSNKACPCFDASTDWEAYRRGEADPGCVCPHCGERVKLSK